MPEWDRDENADVSRGRADQPAPARMSSADAADTNATAPAVGREGGVTSRASDRASNPASDRPGERSADRITRATAAELDEDESIFGLPRWIGRFRLGKQLGRGGMGAVYAAEQEQPRRTVALKILRSSMAAATAQQRFEQEVQVLAQLQHVGIATIYDAGTQRMELGDPLAYFAMEYVPGAKPIDEYARVSGLSDEAKLTLFALVCDAIEYAHSRGVVHRDIKPGNILVDIAGNPKVIDFGIALLEAEDGTVAPRHTSEGVAVGTKEYMSPEQTGGVATPIDHRTDVYSLAVLLYELMTGSIPFEFAGKSDFEVLRTIREAEPTTPRKHNPHLSQDIETIILRGMAKEPDRRYASAAALAADVRRYLSGEPIEARKDSPTYVLRRRSESSAARHPLAWGLWAIVIASVLAYYPAVKVVFEWTALDRWWGRIMIAVLPQATMERPQHTMLVGIKEQTNGAELGAAIKVDGISAKRDRTWRPLDGRFMERLAALDRRPLVVAFDFNFSNRDEPYPSPLSVDWLIPGVRALDRVGVAVEGTSSDQITWSQLTPEDRDKVMATALVEAGVRVGHASGDPKVTSANNVVLDLAVWFAPREGGATGGSLQVPVLETFGHASLALGTVADFWLRKDLRERHPDFDASEIRRRYQLTLTHEGADIQVNWVGQNGAPTVAAREVGAAVPTEPRKELAGGLRDNDRNLVYEAPLPNDAYFEGTELEFGTVLLASDAQLERWFADKIVFVGALDGSDSNIIDAAGNRHDGPRANISAIESILAAKRIRRPTERQSWFVVVLVSVLGAGVGMYGWRHPIRIVFGVVGLTVLLGLGSVMSARFAGLVFNPMVPLVGALVAGCAACWIRYSRWHAARTVS